MKTQTLTDIRRLLQSCGASPRRRLGQNFLIDGNLLRGLVRAADIAPDEWVLEVGGGTGVLTDHLAVHAARLAVVEIDPLLYHLLVDRFAANEHVIIHQGDALEGKHGLSPFIRSFMAEKSTLGENPPISLVANLPYQIATPLIINLLLESPRVHKLCFTVQHEVAERIASPPNRKSYGPVSVIIQSLCTIHHIRDVPTTAFWPRPQVDSTMLRLDRLPNPPLAPMSMRTFAAFVRDAFLHRRKTLTSNLRPQCDETLTRVADAGLDLTRRPAELAPNEWIVLFEKLVLNPPSDA